MLKSIDEYERIRILYMNQKDVVKLALRCLEIRVFKLLQSKYVTEGRFSRKVFEIRSSCIIQNK